MADTVSGLWGEVDYEALLGASSSKSTTQRAAERNVNNSLDKDAFLQLLVTQLKYQDPLNPVDDKEFIGQMAQLTSLEQMQNMNKSITQQQAFSMIGKYILAEKFNEQTGTYETIEGTVSAVNIKSGETVLKVDGKDVPLDSVKAVTDTYNMSSSISNINNSLVTSQNIALIGRYIQAITLDSEGNPKEYVEGQVEYAKISGGNVVLVVGEKEVFAYEIVSVADESLMMLGKTINAQISENEVIKNGTIQGVNIVGDSAYLVIDGKEVYISKINYPSEALRYVGKEVSYKDTTGKVDSVIIKNGVPYFQIGDIEISYKDYKGIS